MDIVQCQGNKNCIPPLTFCDHYYRNWSQRDIVSSHLRVSGWVGFNSSYLYNNSRHVILSHGMHIIVSCTGLGLMSPSPFLYRSIDFELLWRKTTYDTATITILWGICMIHLILWPIIMAMTPIPALVVHLMHQCLNEKMCTEVTHRLPWIDSPYYKFPWVEAERNVCFQG